MPRPVHPTITGVMAVPRFERFFREAAEIDVDKDDLKRFNGFVFDRVYALLLRGSANATANLRDVIEPWDLPIPAGLQERIHEFERLDNDLELDPFLADLAARPQLDVALGDETVEQLPLIAGGLGVALARTFRTVDHDVVNPSSAHWDRATAIFDLIL